MGLDAVVYRSSDSLTRMFGAGSFEVDETTGEALLKAGAPVSPPFDATVALRLRLGNVDKVRALRQKVELLLGCSDSVILRRVLYSGTHSGDTVGHDEFPALRREIGFLQAQEDTELKDLASSLQSLVGAAEAERNPIVFV